jgi:hypothetical protein
VRRIGVLMPSDENDPDGKLRYSAVTQVLAALGWTNGRNVRIDLRWGGGDINRIQAHARELVGLQPDVIMTSGTPATALSSRVIASYDVTTYHNYPQRTGWNKHETALRPCNVDPRSFGLITAVPILNSQIDAQPLVVTHQEIESVRPACAAHPC